MGLPFRKDEVAANTLFIEKDRIPGVCVLSGGDTNNALDTSQEPRTLVTMIFDGGFEPPMWEAVFTISTDEEYDDAVRLKKKYAPQPRKRHPEAFTFANSYLREQDIQACIIKGWSPMVAPTPGMAYVFKIRFIQAFPVGFRPDKSKSKSKKNKQKPLDVKQRTARAVVPEEDLDVAYDNARTPPTDPTATYKGNMKGK